MKKIVVVLFFLFSSVSVMAQKTPNVQKYFPGITWKKYVQKKGIYLIRNYYNLDVSNFDAYDQSDEEDDSLFIAEVINYLEIKPNRDLAISWMREAIDNDPKLKSAISIDNLIEVIKTEFKNNPAITDSLLEELNAYKKESLEKSQ